MVFPYLIYIVGLLMSFKKLLMYFREILRRQFSLRQSFEFWSSLDLEFFVIFNCLTGQKFLVFVAHLSLPTVVYSSYVCVLHFYFQFVVSKGAFALR